MNKWVSIGKDKKMQPKLPKCTENELKMHSVKQQKNAPTWQHIFEIKIEIFIQSFHGKVKEKTNHTANCFIQLIFLTFAISSV